MLNRWPYEYREQIGTQGVPIHYVAILEKSSASLLLSNFGIGIGVHPSSLQIKKKIDAKVCHLPYR